MKKVRLLLTAIFVTAAMGLSACTSVTGPDCGPNSGAECGTYGPNG